MNDLVYNVSNFLGLLLTSIGVGMINIPWGLITAGILLIALNVYNQRMMKGN